MDVHENAMVTKYATLFDFLQDHKYDKSRHQGGATHTRIGKPTSNIHGGSYYIEDDSYDQFMELYYQQVVVRKKREYLTEKQQVDRDTSPIAVDLDLHFALDLEKRVYGNEHVEDIVDCYLAELSDMFQFDDNTAFPIFVFEKKNLNRVAEKNITKDGLHIIIGLQMSHKAQTILRERVLPKVAEALGDFPLVNSWEDVFDKGISAGYTNWQLYGSAKPDHEAYALTKVYEVSIDPEDGEMINERGNPKDYLTLDKFKMLSVRYKGHPSYFYKSSFMEVLDAAADGGATSPKKKAAGGSGGNDMALFGEGSGSSEIAKITTAEQLDNYLQRFLESLTTREYPLKELYEYTQILNDSYYGNGSYAKWIRVGWALRNTSNRLLIVWIAFSARASSFQYSCIPDLCEQWDAFDIKKDAGVTRRSIIYWAKEGNSEGAELVRKSTIGYYIDLTISQSNADPSRSVKGCGDYDLAYVLHEMYKDEYVCSDVKNGSWWRFKNHRWREVDCGNTLRKAISTDMRDLYEARASELQNYLSTLDPEDDKYKVIKLRIDTTMKIIQRLGQTSDKKNIMQEAKDLFYDEEFYESLDSNPWLMACKNGVVDFKNKEFRKGVPEDYLTKCTELNYYPLSSSRHKQNVGDIHAFMEKIFVEDELREYMWNHLSAMLIGMPSLNQSLYNYIGHGQNGKSVLTDLMSHVLGSYKATAPISIITQGRGKVGGLAPEIVALKGARYVAMQEPESTDVIHEGPMKELVSGVEPITARAPYMTKSVTFIPQFALIVCCNQLMSVRTQDHGTWRRLKVIPFDSLFTPKPVKDDPDKPNQFLIDYELTAKFPVWRETFLAMLVERAYENQGRVRDCATVLSASNAYRERQDYLSEFVRDKVTRAAGYSIRKGDLSNEFKQWYIVNVGTKNPSPKLLHDYMDKQFGKNRAGVWKDVKIKLYDDGDFQQVEEEQQEYDADNIDMVELEEVQG